MAGANTSGMAIPGVTSLMGAQGGGSLMQSPADQVQNETEEERRKRLQAMQMARTQPGMSAVLGSGYGAALNG